MKPSHSLTTREQDGWRAGKPVEDPAKTKRWGFVSAKPSEFLVHCRRGSVLATSGQGASCFKWPWDSVSVVPTSLQKIRFVADQVTRERVGVAISGLAVYRVADPLLAYRVLNFSFPERAQEKLEETLTEMLTGATRRLVANLTVDECLEKRKAALAVELLRELAPVLSGEGRLEDVTDQGWGIVLDTVEIQEVRVLSDKVFDAMQMPFRAALDRRAREAKAEADRASELIETSARQEVQEASLAAQAAVRARQGEIQRRESEQASHDQIRKIELALAAETARVQDAQRRQALLAAEAEAEMAAHEVLSRARELAAESERQAWLVEGEKRRAIAAVDLEVGRYRGEVAMIQAKAEAESASAQARLVTAHKLPELAAAVGARFGEVKVTQIGSGGDSPFGSIAQAITSVLEMAKAV